MGRGIKHKVVITGGCGFIGNAIVRKLALREWPALVIDDLSAGTLALIADIRTDTVIALDVSSVSRRQLEDWEGADWVHLASLPHIPDSFKDPKYVVQANIQATRAACQLALSSHARRLVMASSAEVYGAAGTVGSSLSEESALVPLSPYGESKVAAEAVCREYDMRGLNVVILRLFNTYGPNATHPYFIPEMIRQCIKGSEIRVGNLHTVRDFTFVEDMAEAILTATMAEDIDGNIINLGTGNGLQMREVLERIQTATQVHAKLVVVDAERVRPATKDPKCLVADTTKAKSLLGWRARLSFEHGLEKTIEAYVQSTRWPYEIEVGQKLTITQADRHA